MNFAFFLSVCCVMLTIKVIVFLKRRMKVTRWTSAFRHVVALLGAWAGFSFICTSFLVIDLFEADKFSVAELLTASEIGMSLWMVGLVMTFIMILAVTKTVAHNVQDR